MIGRIAMARREMLALGLTGMPLLSACAQRVEAPGVRQRRGPSTIVWTSWATDDLGKNRVQEQADLFMQEYPEITIDIQNYPSSGYLDKVIALLAAGTGPDVFRANPNSAIGMLDHVQELDGLLAKEKGTWWGSKDVKPGVMDWGRYRGKMLGFPMGTGAYYAFHVNKDLFDKAGLPYPPEKYNDPSWTFDRVLELAKALTVRSSDGVAEQLGIDRGMSWSFLHPVVMSWGGDYFDENTGEFKWHEPVATDAIQWMADLLHKHRVAPTPEEARAGVGNFVNGKLAIRWSTFNLAMYLINDVGERFRWDVAPPPRFGARPPRLWFYVSWWVLNRGTRNLEDAFLFDYWVSGPKGERVSVEYAWSIPHFYSLDAKLGLRMGQKKNLTVALDCLNYVAKSRPELNRGYDEAMRVLGPALARVANGETTAKQAMQQIKPEMDRLLRAGLER